MSGEKLPCFLHFKVDDFSLLNLRVGCDLSGDNIDQKWLCKSAEIEKRPNEDNDFGD